MLRSLAIASLVLLAPTAVRAQNADAMELAKKLTTDGALTFETRNAQAMADSYTDGAEVFLVSQNKNTGQLKVEPRRGRAAIEALYADFFKDGQLIQAKNHVDHAKFVTPDLLLITGTFEITKGESTWKLPFVQVRAKQGEKWLLNSVRLFLSL